MRTASLAAHAEAIQRVSAVVLIAVGAWTMVSLSVPELRELFARVLLPYLP
jgi:hypothetical protein